MNGEREGNVTVEKVDEKTREVLHGAIFSCYAYDPGSCDYNRESAVLTLSEEVDSEGRPTGVYRNPMPLLANAGNNGRFLVVETEGPVDEETGERIYAAGWEREIDLFEKADWEFTVGSGEPAENRPTSFAIYKVDEEGNLLDGAKFRIWPEGNEDAFWEKVTGEDGETGAILLGGLDATKRTPLAAGTTYYYKEVSPPPGGFAIDEKVREFKVDVDGTILGASSGHVKVVNHPRSLLLYAGGEGRLDGLLYGLAAAVGLAVAGICRDRKRRKLVLVRVTNGNGERQADGSAQLASGDAKRQADGSAQPASGDAKRQQDAAQARASRGRDGKRQVRGVVQIDLGDEEGNVKKRVWMF